MKFQWKRILWIVLGLAAVGLIVVAMLPKPVPVETVAVRRGDLQVVVEAEGETRVVDRFVVAAPVTGRLSRVELDAGDRVAPGDPITTIAPPPLDLMQQSELNARIDAAEANVKAAAAAVGRARVEEQQAERERDRLRGLLAVGSIPAHDLELAEKGVESAQTELEGAQARLRAANSEVEVVRSGRLALGGAGGSRLVEITSPVAGRVLRVIERDARLVAAGTPLVAIGDPTRLEVVVDVLSSDAVSIPDRAPIEIVGWGGEKALNARVKYIEPSAFTKVSVLGIDEQRVNVVAELLDHPPELGDGFRVDARIIIWQGTNVLMIPTSALFRSGSDWSVFVIEGEKARKRTVRLGHRGTFEVEILEGLKEGDVVIQHPSDKIDEGVAVEPMKG